MVIQMPQTVHSPDAVNENSTTPCKTTPSDILDESRVLDQCSSSGGEVPILPEAEAVDWKDSR